MANESDVSTAGACSDLGDVRGIHPELQCKLANARVARPDGANVSSGKPCPVVRVVERARAINDRVERVGCSRVPAQVSVVQTMPLTADCRSMASIHLGSGRWADALQESLAVHSNHPTVDLGGPVPLAVSAFGSEHTVVRFNGDQLVEQGLVGHGNHDIGGPSHR